MPSPRKLLVVEDNPDTRESLRMMLELEGYQVREAPNGREALDRLAEDPAADCIILDLRMPVMDGFQFLQERQRHRALAAIPVLVVSGEHEAAPAGAAGFFTKPVDPEAMLAALRALAG